MAQAGELHINVYPKIYTSYMKYSPIQKYLSDIPFYSKFPRRISINTPLPSQIPDIADSVSESRDPIPVDSIFAAYNVVLSRSE